VGAPGLAGQSGLDDEDAMAPDDDEDSLEDDEAPGTTWAPAAAANTTVMAANGIRYLMGLVPWLESRGATLGPKP
jgi:hypothetical protein